jgi:hypothetical protein
MAIVISACGSFSNGVMEYNFVIALYFFAIQTHRIIKKMDPRIQGCQPSLRDAFLKKCDYAKENGLLLDAVGKTETCKSMCLWSLLYSYHRLRHNPVVSFLLAIWCYCFSKTELDAAISDMISIIQQLSTKEQPPPEQPTEEIATEEPIKIAADEPGDANESEDAKEDGIISSIWGSCEQECEYIDITRFRQGLCGMCHGFLFDGDGADEIEKYINELSEEQLKALLNMMLIAVKRDYPHDTIDLDFLLDENHQVIPLYVFLEVGLTELATDSNNKFIDVLLWMEFFANRSIR